MHTPDGIRCVNLTLLSLVASAYGIKPDLISGGGGWTKSAHFDIEAKVAGEDVETLKRLTPHQRSEMLKPLLEERFHFKAHVETKTLPIYELVIAKGGTKLTPAPPDTAPSPDIKPSDALNRRGWIRMGLGRFDGTDIPAQNFADNLSNLVHRTVIDKTGLTGEYDIKLKWTPEEQAMSSGPNADNGADSGPSIFTAIEEQLGLKLVPSKGPVDTLVIDQVEMPTEN